MPPPELRRFTPPEGRMPMSAGECAWAESAPSLSPSLSQATYFSSALRAGTVDLTVFPALNAERVFRRERCRDDRDTERHDEEDQAGAVGRGAGRGRYGAPGPGAGPVPDRAGRAAEAADQDGARDRVDPGAH